MYLKRQIRHNPCPTAGVVFHGIYATDSEKIFSTHVISNRKPDQNQDVYRVLLL